MTGRATDPSARSRVLGGGSCGAGWSRRAAPFLAGALLVCGCSRGPRARGPSAAFDRLARDYDHASEVEQSGDDGRATDAYLDLVDHGLGAGEEGAAAVVAGLDALVWRDAIGVDRVGPNHALAFRAAGGVDRVTRRLGDLYEGRRGAGFTRSFVADALAELARFRGDAAAATSWRARTGSVSRATAVGPLDAAPLSAVDRPTPLESGSDGLRASYPGLAPFAASVAPFGLEADDGELDLGEISTQPGLYAIAVDVTVAREQRVWAILESTSTAAVVVGGQLAVARPYRLGGSAVTRVGSVKVGAGVCRVVVRVGQNDDGGHLSLALVGDDGTPLPTAASGPRPAPALGREPARWLPHTDTSPAIELSGAALLGLGESRAARRELESLALADATPPAATLVYARAVDHADDVPDVRRPERARTAYDHVLKRWPGSWEATIGRALYASARRGPGEGRVEMLRDLEKARAERPSLSPIVRAFEGASAAEAGLRDVAHKAYDDVAKPLAGTALLVSLDGVVHPRAGAEAEAFACGAGLHDRQSVACFDRHLARGDVAAAFAELARLRALHGSPHAFWQQEATARLAAGDTGALLRFYDALPPGRRALVLLGALEGRPGVLRERLGRDALVARDSPAQISPLLRLVGDDPAPPLEADAARLVAADRAKPATTSAATFVLAHTERYDIERTGLMHSVLHDLRRVGGTTDVEQGVGGTATGVIGRDARRTLRRLIYKKDGRVLEPDRANNANQGNADLSQLEPGDYIEQLIEGFTLPNRAGQVVVETPDLLPERTSVASASIEVRFPRDLALARWAHPLLGKPSERDDGSAHVVRYELRGAAPRRIEDAVALADRDVSVTFGTYTWDILARQFGDQIRATVDEDPVVDRWARAAIGDAPPASRQAVERLVVASGKSVRVANAALYSDAAAAMGGGAQQQTARQVLDLGQGSRTLLLYQSFASVGVPAEIVVAEREPFSSDPNYPPRPGRFDRPLLVAHLAAAAGGDVWIDADVEGPPLPAGRVSPELRGRAALTAGGKIISVVGGSGSDTRDDVDVNLSVDERGDASGTVTVILRGRTSQALADTLERVVGSDRRDLLRNVVLGWLPWANVNDVSLSSSEGSWQVSLRADVAVPSYAQQEGDAWVLPGLEPLHAVYPRPGTSTLGATYTTQSGRQSALSIGNAFQYHVRRHVALPVAVRPLAPLPRVAVKQERLEASRVVRLSGSAVDEEFDLSLPTGTIGAAAYGSFADDARRVDDGFLASVRLSHAARPAPPK